MEQELEKLNQLAKQEEFSLMFHKVGEVLSFFSDGVDFYLMLLEAEVRVEDGCRCLVNAADCKVFFQCLSQFQREHPEVVIASPTVNNVLSKLVKHKYLTISESEEIQTSLHIEFTLREYEEQAMREKDIIKTLALTVFHRTKDHFFGSASLIYLMHAMFCKGSIDYLQIFKWFNGVNTLGIFDETKDILLALAQAPIKQLELPKNDDWGRGKRRIKLGKKIGFFIEHTTSLQFVKIGKGSGSKPLSDAFISPIIQALNKNTSIQTLSLYGVTMKNKITQLMEAIKNNPESKINEISLDKCEITDEDAQVLIELMKTHPVRVEIKRHKISDVLLKEIESLRVKSLVP